MKGMVMKRSSIKMSLAAVTVLGTVAYAGNIVGANPGDTVLPQTQFGFGGWNLDNVDVKIVSTEDFVTVTGEFNSTDGTYTTMEEGDSFESDITTGGLLSGVLHGKDWPVGEPAGIKVINNDTKTHNGKPENCILTTSYLAEENNGGVNGFLDGEPAPVICSSPFQTHKRFKVNFTEDSVVDYNTTTRYGKPVDLVFNLDGADISTENTRYQVFSKINNYSGMRLDGYKIEVIKEDGSMDDNLTLSLGILEHRDDEGNLDNTDIWSAQQMANFSNGLWGAIDNHFDTNGFFDDKSAGFIVSGHGTTMVEGGPTTLGSNYEDLFGLWLPSKWQPYGIFWDDDNDPLTDAALMAFWGDPLNTGTNAWHKGQDYDLSDGDQSWAEPTDKELVTWTINPLYEIGHIEDTLNLGLNYIVNVGTNANIGSKFTIRITPRVAADQTPPSYIDGDGNYIEPPTSYAATAGVVTVTPEPTFTPGTDLYVGVADADLNQDTGVAEEVTITVVSDIGDSEDITLTETDVDSGVFSATLSTENSGSGSTANDGVMSVIEDSVVTATYVDEHYGNTGTSETLTASTTAKTPVTDDPTDPTDPTVPDTPDDSDGNPPSSGGGGCTYNPNSNSFDMTFLMMIALGSLYAFRRRFIK
jgi:hypothetical protein